MEIPAAVMTTLDVLPASVVMVAGKYRLASVTPAAETANVPMLASRVNRGRLVPDPSPMIDSPALSMASDADV
jgi:hypothetical protein